MKKIKIVSFVFLIGIFKLSGQTQSGQLEEADDLFLNDRFAAAFAIYRDFFKMDSSNTTLNFKIGVCYLNSRSQKNNAILYLEKSLSPASPVISYKFLGDAYQLANKFDLAIASYEKFRKMFLASKPRDLSIMEEVNWKIEMCKVGKKLQELPAPHSGINADYIDYSSALSPDQSTMTFTFHKTGSVKNKSLKDGKYFEGLYIPVKTATQASAKISMDTTTDRSEAAVATSIDGQIVLTYQDVKGDGNLYITRLIGNQWSAPEKLTGQVNTKGWEQNEFISANGYLLYFASNRAGGFGGKDIYACKKLPNGEWGKAMNLGPVINTAYDEEAPFIYSDALTLFFSSNKNKQTCCFDNFSSTLSNDGSWTEPVKIGYPVKKTAAAVFYAATSNHQEASVPGRKDSVYKTDMYVATFMDLQKAPFTVIKGRVTDIYGKIPVHVKITVTDNETGEVVGVYNSNYKTGNYLLSLPPGRNNNITYEAEGYLFQSENIDISKKPNYYETHKAIEMPPVTPGSKVALSNIFFDFDRTTFCSVSNVELNKLFLLLTANPRMIVELSCPIHTQENSKYNIKLALDRSQSVANYLIEKGINKERLIVSEPGKLKLPRRKGKPDKNAQPAEEQLAERVELKIISIK